MATRTIVPKTAIFAAAGLILGACGVPPESGSSPDAVASTARGLSPGERELCVAASIAQHSGTTNNITLRWRSKNKEWSCDIAGSIPVGETRCCVAPSATPHSGMGRYFEVETDGTDGLMATKVSKKKPNQSPQTIDAFDYQYAMSKDVECRGCRNGRDCGRCWVDRESTGAQCGKVRIHWDTQTVECARRGASQDHAVYADPKELCVQAASGTYSGTNNDVSLEYVNLSGTRKWACTIDTDIAPGAKVCCTDDYAVDNFGRNADSFQATVHGSDGLEINKFFAGTEQMGRFAPDEELRCESCDNYDCDTCWIDEVGSNDCESIRLEWRDISGNNVVNAHAIDRPTNPHEIETYVSRDGAVRLHARDGNPDFQIRASYLGPQDADRFRLGYLPDERVYLKTYLGRYVSAVNGGGAGISGAPTSIGDNESFELVHLPDGKYAFESINGYYITVVTGGAVHAQRGTIGLNQTLNMWGPGW